LGTKTYFEDKTKRGYPHDTPWVGGKPVYAICDCTVHYYQHIGIPQDRESPKRGEETTVSYGNVAYLEGKNGEGALYAHLERFEGIPLKNGNSARSFPSSLSRSYNETRKRYLEAAIDKGYVYCGSRDFSGGQVIGYVGTTGNSTANHLHFELFLNTKFKDNANRECQKFCVSSSKNRASTPSKSQLTQKNLHNLQIIQIHIFLQVIPIIFSMNTSIINWEMQQYEIFLKQKNNCACNNRRIYVR
jgi:hypothetical protein